MKEARLPEALRALFYPVEGDKDLAIRWPLGSSPATAELYLTTVQDLMEALEGGDLDSRERIALHGALQSVMTESYRPSRKVVAYSIYRSAAHQSLANGNASYYACVLSNDPDDPKQTTVVEVEHNDPRIVAAHFVTYCEIARGMNEAAFKAQGLALEMADAKAEHRCKRIAEEARWV